MIKEYCIALLHWCEVKILLWDKRANTVFKEGEIWWCRIGMNVGMEIYGKGKDLTRPVLILKKFNADLFFGIPLTSKRKEGSWYAPILYGSGEGGAILHQARSMDKKRLIKRIGTLRDDSFKAIHFAFADFYGIATLKNNTPSHVVAERVGNPKDASIIAWRAGESNIV